MFGLGYGFRFIDLIKTESKRSKVLELFVLGLNTINIETPRVGTTSVGLLKVLFSGTLLFVLPFSHICFFYHIYNISGSYFVHLFQQIWLQQI